MPTEVNDLMIKVIEYNKQQIIQIKRARNCAVHHTVWHDVSSLHLPTSAEYFHHK